jgi:hypothetical protein
MPSISFLQSYSGFPVINVPVSFYNKKSQTNWDFYLDSSSRYSFITEECYRSILNIDPGKKIDFPSQISIGSPYFGKQFSIDILSFKISLGLIFSPQLIINSKFSVCKQVKHNIWGLDQIPTDRYWIIGKDKFAIYRGDIQDGIFTYNN